MPIRFLSCLLLISLVLLVAGAHQPIGAQQRTVPIPETLHEADALVPSPGILSNSVETLRARGDSLWVGPYLNLTTDAGATWQATDADALRGLQNLVFSLRGEGPVLVAGLGNRVGARFGRGRVNVSRGFLISGDDGRSWAFRSPRPPLDGDPTTTGILDLPEDTVTVYGASSLPTLPITEPTSTPPRGVAYDAATGTLWSANVRAGLRRSADQGRSWERVVLPPDTLQAIAPEMALAFPFFAEPIGPASENFAGRNFRAYDVLVDATGRIWAGTEGGVNWSDDGVAWQRRGFDGTPDGLNGSWVLRLAEQPTPEGPVLWLATRPSVEPDEIAGVAFTADGGQTFEQTLAGEQIFDFAFREDVVFAAGRSGLFTSRDGGRSWTLTRRFLTPDDPNRSVRVDTEVFAVETVGDALWIGTDDGLFRSRDAGRTWQLFRPDVPLTSDEASAVVPGDLVPDVDTFAYPNPYSPARDTEVRIRFDLERPQSVTIRIFDFGMNLVRTLNGQGLNAGRRELSWDGTDQNGAVVANGAYLYTVDTGSRLARGKILVLE